MKTVVIIQTILTHYRIPLFEELRRRLSDRDIKLRLIHGRRSHSDNLHNDEGFLEWAEVVENKIVKFPGGVFLWQPVRKMTNGCDLVIMPQHNRLVANWLLIAFPGTRITALWGHGQHFQGTSLVKAYLRKKLAVLPDWWFPYTDYALEAVEETGFDKTHITVLQNAVDTSSLQRDIAETTQEKVAQRKNELGLTGTIGVFCSSLYKGKRIDFLLQAAKQIRKIVPDFELLIIGDGPEKPLLDKASGKNAWIKPVGAKFGKEKALLLLCGQIFLMPYSVGLSILDAFCAGLPLVVVEKGQHGPEIAYLKEGVNGLSTASSVESYGMVAADLLLDQERLHAMREAAEQDSSLYTIEAMAERFTDGIIKTLNTIKRRP